MTDVIGKPHGPHRGQVDIKGATSFDAAVRQAVEAIDVFVGDHEFALSSYSSPLTVETGDGTTRVIAWDVSFDWRITAKTDNGV